MVSSTCLVNSARVSCGVPAASFATSLATSLSKLNPAAMNLPKNFGGCLFRQGDEVPEHLVHVPGVAQRGSTPLFWCELFEVADQVLAFGVNKCPGFGGHNYFAVPLSWHAPGSYPDSKDGTRPAGSVSPPGVVCVSCCGDDHPINGPT